MTVFLSSGLGKRKSQRDVSDCDGAQPIAFLTADHQIPLFYFVEPPLSVS
jgi:hypothetical protein